MSSKSRLYDFLMEKSKATNAEIADYMRGYPGQLSWGQRIREIRKDLQAKGGDLTCYEIRTGIYLYEVVLPEQKDTPHEEAIRRNNLIQEQTINFKEVNKQMEFAV